MKIASVVVVVVALLGLERGASAGHWLEETEAWKRAHDDEIRACLQKGPTSRIDPWFLVDARPTAAPTVTLVVPASDEVVSCLRGTLASFRPSVPLTLYLDVPSSRWGGRPSYAVNFDKADSVPDRLFAHLVEWQLAPALPSLAKCVELHGKHLPQLELVMERAYSPSMTVRYLREQPSSLRTGEERNSRPLGACYAERILAERARLVWPSTLPKREAPALDVFMPPSYPQPHAPVVYVRRAGNSR